MKILTYYFLTLTLLVTLVTGCTGSFADINTDPDSPSEVPPTNVLAYVLRYTSALYGSSSCIQGPSAWGGHTAEIQYISQSRYDSYGYGTSYMFEYTYYYLLNNLVDIIEMTEASGNDNLNAVAKIWMCYLFHSSVDQLGAMPYFEGVQGKNILKPKYDSAETIYEDIFEVLEACNTTLAQNVGRIGEGDILFGGDPVAWQRFANSLKLRMAMRVSKSSMASQAKTLVSTLLSNPAKYPLVTTNSASCMMKWPATNGYYEPWYNNTLTRDDYAISDIIVNQLWELDDPRLPFYASPITSTDQEYIDQAHIYEGKPYKGAPIGPSGQENLNSVSRMGKPYRDTPDGFTPHLLASEVWFNIAEAAALGWTSAYGAETAYANGVTCSMEEHAISPAQIATYLAGKAKYTGLESIYTQLWLSLFKNGNEAWAIYRKSGIPTTHGIAKGSNFSNHNSVPFTYPYPTSEYDYNQANVSAIVSKQSDGDYLWAKRMFWDVRPGVY